MKRLSVRERRYSTTRGKSEKEWVIYTRTPSEHFRDLEIEEWFRIGEQVWDTVTEGRKIVEEEGQKLLRSR